MRRRSGFEPGLGPIRVLVVNQTSLTSGAEHSLLTLLAAFEPSDVTVVVACPTGGLSDRVKALGLEHVPIKGTEASFRLNLRTTPVELLAMVRSAAKVGWAARRQRVDVVHANTTRAGLIAIVARLFGAPRPLVHIRDWTPPGRAAALVNRVIARGAGAIVANSRFIAGNFDGLPTHGPVRVIHNPVDLTRFDPGKHDRAATRAALGIGTDAETESSTAADALGTGTPQEPHTAQAEPLVAGVVGQLTPWKGQDDAVRAMAVVLERPGLADAHLMIAGSAKFAGASSRHDIAGYADTLAALPARLGIEASVSFLGEVDDVPAVLAALDVLLVPSWQEAFGRVVIEGMAMGLPVIATTQGGPTEIIDDGRTGLLLAPRDPATWGLRLADLLNAPEERAALGAAAREAAQRFAPAAHAAAVLAVYRDLTSA